MNANVDNEFDSIFRQNVKVDSKQNWQWRYSGFLVWRYICEFFHGPNKHKKESGQQFRDVAESLIVSLQWEEKDETKKVILDSSKSLLDSHRMVEDTHARRRLERWARNTIKFYLIAVLIIVILNGLSRIIWPDIFIESGFISDSVMYAILTTTTVNILGLGFIILRGHFSNKGDISKDNK